MTNDINYNIVYMYFYFVYYVFIIIKTSLFYSIYADISRSSTMGSTIIIKY